MSILPEQPQNREASHATLADMRQNLRKWWACAFTPALPGEDVFALTGPTGYVFQTDGVFWGVDLCLRYPWAAALLGDDCGRYCEKLAFLAYTHEHGDHMDPILLERLAGCGLPIVVPYFMEVPHIPEKRLLRVRAGERYTWNGVNLTPFVSRHYRKGTRNGVPEYGYYVETARHRILLPGDIRDYSLPAFPAHPCDWLFAHLWLGDDQADKLPCQPYTDAFADFVCDMAPSRIAITHLYESARDDSSIWTFTHAGIAADAIYRRNPGIRTVIPRPGEQYRL